MKDVTYKFPEKSGLLCYLILVATKSFFDYLTDSKTKRKYYEKYLEELLERK